MEPESPAYGHEELKKMHDHGFGRAVKGFRTTADAIAFKRRWELLSHEELRRLYPEQMRNASNDEVRALQILISLKIQQQGIGGLIDIFGGSAQAVERALKAGLDSVAGTMTRGGAVGSIGTSLALLARDVALDIYIFGTGPTNVPDFDDFILYRGVKAMEYELNRRIRESLSD